MTKFAQWDVVTAKLADPHRIVDCLNACGGMANPVTDLAALRGQVATLRKAIQAALPVIHMVALHPLNKSNCPLGTYNQLVAALAATAAPKDQEARHE